MTDDLFPVGPLARRFRAGLGLGRLAAGLLVLGIAAGVACGGATETAGGDASVTASPAGEPSAPAGTTATPDGSSPSVSPAASPTAAGEPGSTATAAAPPTATARPDPSPTATAIVTETGLSRELPYADPPDLEFRPLGTRTGSDTALDPAFEPLPGAVGFHGRLGDAVYRVELPAGWDGDGLVIWAHGFRGLEGPVYVSSPPRPLREAILESGYGWAASSFSENGYTPGIGADDSLALRLHLERELGPLGNVVLAGHSMGGNVVVLALENYPGAFAGGLSFCGAVGGEEQLDYILSWGLLAEYFTGVHLPVGESGPVYAALLQMGVLLGSPQSPTPQGARFASVIRELTGGPRPFFQEGFAEQFSMNFTLLAADPERKTVQIGAASNEDTVYRAGEDAGVDEGVLNAEIRRIAPLPGTRDASAHPDAVPTSGRLTAPLLSVHGTGDLFVPISLEVAYRAKAESRGTGGLLVQRAVRAAGHCRFSREEYRRSWADLLSWVETGNRPAGELLGEDLTDVGLAFTDPLRPGDPGGR